MRKVGFLCFLRLINYLTLLSLFRLKVFKLKAFCTVWPYWVIYCTSGNFSKPVAKIILPKLPIFLDNFCKGVKIFHFSSEIFLCNFWRHLATFSGHTASVSSFSNQQSLNNFKVRLTHRRFVLFLLKNINYNLNITPPPHFTIIRHEWVLHN